ncbi:MAG: zinc-ribbon domain-containing protein [Lactobacillaceae bacterium]|jgi:predicted Zn finger-like uncharacterized protein|nr:zinc-ribbon domain-containing protein [Lactobacillaceae bacterium]
MIITCPKCKTSYEVDDKLITAEGKKVHCFNCGEIWVEYKKNEALSKEKTKKLTVRTEETVVENEEPIIDPAVFKDEIKRTKKEKDFDADNIDEIFSSFSVRKERDFDNYKPAPKKCDCGRFANVLLFLLSLLVVVAFCLYYLRYEITKNYPAAKPIYEKLGIEASYFGQGLVFEDVTKLEYDDGFYPQMIVTGFITNKNKARSAIPTISVKFFDDNDLLIEDIWYNTRVGALSYNESVQFDVSLDKPDVPIKYVIVTFVK